MTTFQPYRIRNRDQQDGFERHVWGDIEYVDGAGAVARVRGTGTEDSEAPILNTGYGMQYSKNFNTEVMLVSLGSDTDQKYAIVTIPRDKQRRWAEGTGGVQNPLDPERAIEFSKDGIHLKDGTFFIGDNKEVKLTVASGQTTITVNKLVINADVEINGTNLKHNGLNVGSTHVHGGVEPGGANTDGPH